jgi:hypothetical protein
MGDSPLSLTIRDTIQQSQSAMFRQQVEMHETVRLTRATIQASRQAMAEADQLLVRRRPAVIVIRTDRAS